MVVCWRYPQRCVSRNIGLVEMTPSNRLQRTVMDNRVTIPEIE
jgi:hypothetical protein